MDRILDGKTVALIGTGPSLAPAQIATARRRGFSLAGVNNVWEIVPDLRVLYCCNTGWWDRYWCDALRDHPASKWTQSREAADKYGLNWTAERNAPGLSTNPSYIHHGHGSGYSLLNLVYLMGAARILLLGYDLRYASDYCGKARRVGSSPRHFFGEYPESLQHWPSVKVKDGVHVELLDLYRSVADQGLVEIVNCTPGSAIDCFPMVDIDAV